MFSILYKIIVDFVVVTIIVIVVAVDVEIVAAGFLHK